ncbi:ribonuclease H-like domain-containing protein, partial [Tanacetum coccineum]
MLERIKDGIVELKSYMIEGEPWVYGVGFVTIKLSGKLMDENIRKMLRDGLFLSQRQYASQLLEHAHMANCNPSWTPVDTQCKLGPKGVRVQDPTLYRSQYLTFTRPVLRSSTISIMYTFLKYHRLANCKFNYNDMLDIKGDTFVHLLTTQAQIRKITNYSLEDIDELKKASNLGLEEDKVIWSEGVERELGFHLLMFTEVSFCEASAVVTEKGFQLLGITQ